MTECGPIHLLALRAGMVGAWLCRQANATDTNAIAGRIVDESGKGVAGVMVSAIDDEHRKWISVFTGDDGTFSINGLRSVNHHVRTRLMGIADEWRSDVAPGTEDLTIKTRLAEGEELELQRPASSAFSMLKFDDPRDRMNFKMMCSYCHQIGSLGFRTPERAGRLGNDDSSHGWVWWSLSTHAEHHRSAFDGDVQRRRRQELADL